MCDSLESHMSLCRAVYFRQSLDFTEKIHKISEMKSNA